MNYVITDAALFQGTMIHSAMHQRLVTGGIDPCEQEQLKRDTITMLNKRLGDPVFSRDDGTIGAVVCLILLAVCLGILLGFASTHQQTESRG